MAALRTLLLLGLLLTARGQRAAQRRRPPRPQSPLEKVVAQEGLSLQQVRGWGGGLWASADPALGWCHPCAMQLSGKWFLVGMASRCSYLAEHSHQLEATMVTVTVLDGQSLAISTFRKLDRMCWEIRQHYLPTQAPGRFLLKGEGDWSGVDVVVGEADPSSFTILYYQKGHSISVKLYGASGLRASWQVRDRGGKPVLDSGDANKVTPRPLSLAGFCDSADEFHILDGELGMPSDALGAPMCQAWSHTGHQWGVPVLAVGWTHWARSTLYHGCVVLPQECGRAGLARERPCQTIPQNRVCALVWQTHSGWASGASWQSKPHSSLPRVRLGLMDLYWCLLG
uniref:Uncharacterized protein n=1 Tax=Corvus moneduloides TaxID=1196302 RepID=A0A8C3D2F1_CORMO